MNFGKAVPANERLELNKYGLIIYDLNASKQSKLFESNIELIENILNCSRCKLEDEKYDKKIINKVAVGSF